MNKLDAKVALVSTSLVNKKDLILKLKTMFPATDFIVTGSYVLAEYGLMDSNNVQDLDIILVNPTPETTEALKRWMTDFPAYSTTKLPKEVNCQAIFMFDSVKVDVFTYTNFIEPVLIVDGIKYTTIPHILKAKKSYNRMKDWLQCRDISRMFFKQEEFIETLNTSWKSMLRDNY